MIPFFGSSSNIQNWSSTYSTSYSALNSDLPISVHLITVQIPNGDNQSVIVRLRLQNLFQAESISSFAGPVSVDLNTLFNSSFLVSDVKRLTLTGNQAQSKCQRAQWNASPKQHVTHSQVIESTIVTLQPSEIATFSFALTSA